MTGQGMDWTLREGVDQVMGDQGPWVRHLLLAWQAANAPSLDLPLPEDPTDALIGAATGSDEHNRRHRDLIAYWGPLTHLVCFGLGWSRPDLGLARWLATGAPTEDPVLRVVARWWGPDRVYDFLAWAATSDKLVGFGSELAKIGGYHRFNDTRLPDEYVQRRASKSWQAVWGGGSDPLHLIAHSRAPITYPTEESSRGFEPVPHWGTGQGAIDPTEVPRMVIVNDTYRAWHALLWHYRPTVAGNGRSIRTDVVIKPVGWMGEYRYSTETGAWFRGRHRWHLLGH